ncbi:MAG: hemerythrin domain-containing protein [Hyphomicrobiales bacterium]
MTSVMQPLHDEHVELLPHIEAMRGAAEAVARGDAGARKQAQATLDFLDNHLHPHATAEEQVLYPEVGRVMGAPDATKTMRRDHAEIAALREELRSLLAGGGESLDLARVLFALHALVKLHFAKEEEVYVPALAAALSAGEAKAMYERMEAAARAAHGHG